jgi:hypothetical protein
MSEIARKWLTTCTGLEHLDDDPAIGANDGDAGFVLGSFDAWETYCASPTKKLVPIIRTPFHFSFLRGS